LACQAYSYEVEQRRHATHEEALRDLLAAAEAFRPDVLFWQHVHDGYPLDRAFLSRLKALPGRPRLVYHDGDVYGRFVKRMDRTLRTMLAECDLAVVVAGGDFERRVREAGAPRTLFTLQPFDDQRFGRPWQPTRERRFDAVMVGNLACLKRIPGLHLPGGGRRKRLARLCHRAMGERFAVFGSGRGWSGEPYARGPIAYDVQETTLREAWMSLIWGHFDTLPMFASDRLALSLAAGVPHLCNRQPGYDSLFAGARGLFLADSPEELLDSALALLAQPVEQRIALGEQAMAYAREHLTAHRVYGDMVADIGRLLLEGDARARGAALAGAAEGGRG
jgi:hypothetical protein